MFLTEKDLKDTFWKNYNYSGRAIKYQFESPIREGNADLITIESFQGHYQINAFEFKLSDVRKAILQAEGNVPFVNKSWVVLPAEKQQLILEKYRVQLEKEKHIGVIVVEAGGKWQMIHKPLFQKEVKLNQVLVDLMLS